MQTYALLQGAVRLGVEARNLRLVAELAKVLVEEELVVLGRLALSGGFLEASEPLEVSSTCSLPRLRQS